MNDTFENDFHITILSFESISPLPALLLTSHHPLPLHLHAHLRPIGAHVNPAAAVGAQEQVFRFEMSTMSI